MGYMHVNNKIKYFLIKKSAKVFSSQAM